MLILPQMVKVKWTREYKWYISRGYLFTNIGDEFECSVLDLKKSERIKIDVLCDYCLDDGVESVVIKAYSDYLSQRKIIQKDSCKKCYPKKVIESNILRYGVESINQIEEVKNKKEIVYIEKYGVKNISQAKEIKEKVRGTNREKYGVEHPAQNDQIKEKMKNTTRKRYGTDNPFQAKEIKEKIKIANIEKYGVENVSQSDIVKEKRKATSIQNYGVEYPTQSNEVQEKIKITNNIRYGVDRYTQTEEFLMKVKATNLEKYGVDWIMQSEDIKAIARQSFYLHGTGKASKQQIYLNQVISGELNYPASKTLLDIAFPREKIYVEYDGSGHDLSVKIGSKTREEFENREKRRWYALNREGWKQIVIVSRRDYIPSDEKISEIINIGKKYFNNGRSWIKFDIDNQSVISSEGEKTFDYGELRKIKDSDITPKKESEKTLFVI